MLMQINKIQLVFYKLKMKCSRENRTESINCSSVKPKKFMSHTYVIGGKELFINGQLVFSVLAFIMW